jgi:membrane-bound lytic murein transglycosylase D
MRIRFLLLVLLSGILTAGVVPTEAEAWLPDWYRLDEKGLHLSSPLLLAQSGTETEEPAAGDSPLGVTLDSTLSIDGSTPSSPPEAESEPGAPLLEVTTTAPLESVDETLDFDVPIVRAPKIDKHIRVFTFNIRDRFELWLHRLERHRPMVEQIFAEFDLPADLIFLSLVESGFSTNAVSRSKAVGPWQFIKSTGKMYGLRVDKWIDERRDPVKSTLAAAQYLRDLYHLFGSWPLAMAAYNAGERKVGRALARSHADDYWDLTDTKLIKRETKEYVPRFLAATLIAKDPSRYGFLISPQPPVAYEEAILTRPIHLRMAAKAAGVTYEDLKALNPELRKDVTPPYPTYRLKVPVGSKDLLLSNLATYPDWKHVQATRFKVRRGETLLHFATRHRISLSAVLEANALDKSYKPKPGEWLLVPKPVKAKS